MPMNGKDFLETKIAEGTAILDDAVREIKRLAQVALKAQRDMYAYQLALAALTRDDETPYTPPPSPVFWSNINKNDTAESEPFSILECNPSTLWKSKSASRLASLMLPKCIDRNSITTTDNNKKKSFSRSGSDFLDLYYLRGANDDEIDLCHHFYRAFSEAGQIKKKGKSLDLSNTSSTGVIRRILMSSPVPLTIDEMLLSLPEDLGFEMSRETIYGILPRMEARGEITRTRRGEYKYNLDDK